ncbi:Putative nucleoside transporter YegT [Limihaloglobus sulfuriphilus]|uniref:Putative nucleoside transporter YegT n=1 Tax=Limihaloglobus sulfuriphilus TaxID=1851148 RepID=A0A1Q2MBI4_9BACT|nr:nucleoside permease [Limihaloglobus sulfuriphilus]AQQ70019.1 Putative nucleoside transporter YegT [Limihaloglobus sulfuriphilus]
MQSKVKAQLSAMMFLEFFIWGAWYVTMWKYLTAVNFDNIIGLAYSTTGIAAIISPLFIGMIADRFFATEKVLAILHIAGAVLMFAVSEISNSTVFFWVLLGYAVCYMPTLALTNSISLCQMSDPEKEFPPIRVLGTIGWIIAGLIIGFMPESISGLSTIENTSIPMKIAAGASLIMGFYCLTLPHTPPPSAGKKVSVRDVLGLDALKMLRDPQFAIFLICSFLICIPLAFYYQSANGFLGEVGVENAAGKMTLGQASEFFFMLVMPFFFVRLGVKKMLLVGMLAWVARYLMFAFGNSGSLVFMLYIGIMLHGICYDFFFVTGQIYVDKKAPKEIRSSAQGFLALITLGLGMIIGSLINGKVTRYYETAGDIGHNWKMIWLIPCIMAGVVAILFGILFKDEISAKRVQNQPTGAANEFK